MSNEDALRACANTKWSPTKETILASDDVRSRALRIMLSDEAGFYGYTFEQCVEIAQRERDSKDEK